MGTEDSEPEFLLTTPRLGLRRPRADDAGAIAVLADNWQVARNLSTMPHPYRRRHAEEWIAKIGAAAPDGGEAFILVLAAEGCPIGACGYGPTSHLGGFELGYWIGEPYWGRGLATEAARCVIDRAFTAAGLAQLWCSCRVTNDASRRVIQKCGFQFHASGMMESRATGGSLPVEHYCLGREVWRSLTGWTREFDERPQRRLDARRSDVTRS